MTNVEQTEQMNKLVKTFIEHKNLKLSQEKSYIIHIGKGYINCPKLKVHKSDILPRVLHSLIALFLMLFLTKNIYQGVFVWFGHMSPCSNV